MESNHLVTAVGILALPNLVRNLNCDCQFLTCIMNLILQVTGNCLNVDIKKHHVDIIAKLFAGKVADVLNHLLVYLGYIRVVTIDIQVNLSSCIIADLRPLVAEDCSTNLVINIGLNLDVVHCNSNNLFNFLGQKLLYLLSDLGDSLVCACIIHII